MVSYGLVSMRVCKLGLYILHPSENLLQLTSNFEKVLTLNGSLKMSWLRQYFFVSLDRQWSFSLNMCFKRGKICYVHINRRVLGLRLSEKHSSK